MGGGQSFDAGQRALLARIARGHPLPDVLEGIIRHIESLTDGLYGSVLLVDPERKVVRHGASPSLPAGYSNQLDGLTIGPREGSCGAAAYLGERIIVDDIAKHPNWEKYRVLALSHGLRACWSSPIFSPEGDVLGTFAIYYREVRRPTDEEIALVGEATHLAAVAILRERAEAERRTLVAELEQSEARLRAVVENTPDVAIQWYDEDGRMLFCNRASERLFGWEPGAVLGKTLRGIGFFDDHEEELFASARRAAARGERLAPIEFRYTRADGAPGFLLSTVFRIPFNKSSSCYVCMDIDLTDRRRAEDERRLLESKLQQSQRLQALGTLTSGIAHDFNNVLAVILANTELVMSHGPADPVLRENVLDIQRAAQRAADLVARLLTFGRDHSPKREMVDLRTTVDDAASLVGVTAPSSVELRKRYEDGLPAISADPVQMRQVVLNLVSNAFHAMRGRQGVVEISLSRVHVEADGKGPSPELSAGDYVRLAVRDEGCGMDAATQRRIFDPFFTTKPEGEGTGLGLSTVFGIVTAHEGAITVTSELGGGTTFSVHLPVAPPAPSKSVASTGPVTRNERVLFVDDEEALVFLAKRSLHRLGYHVSAHSDPIKALQDFRAHPDAYDVLVTDISMPGLSGPDLVEAVRAVRADLPVVMLTGFVRQEDVRSAARLGVRHVIPKPLSADDLARTLDPLLRCGG